MNYKETLYKNALEQVRYIYEESQYNPDVDLYRSYDIIQSVSSNQISSKEWLVKNLSWFIEPDGKDICILGGWYGLLACMINQHVTENVRIDSVDCDPDTKKYGQQLTWNYSNIRFRVEDAAEWFFDRPKRYQCIINTSCEHMEQEDIDLMLSMKEPDCVACLQSNNYDSVQSHINTHPNLDSFVKSCKLSEIFFQESLRSPDGSHDRYMVIGK